jgi:hypothetical protein
MSILILLGEISMISTMLALVYVYFTSAMCVCVCFWGWTFILHFLTSSPNPILLYQVVISCGEWILYMVIGVVEGALNWFASANVSIDFAGSSRGGHCCIWRYTFVFCRHNQSVIYFPQTYSLIQLLQNASMLWNTWSTSFPINSH